MFERKVMIYDVVYRYHRVVSISHDLAVGVTGIHCEHWNHNTNNFATYHEHPLEVGMRFEDAEDYLMTLDEFTPLPDDEAALVDAQETIANLSEILTDEQAELMPSIYPEWLPDRDYAVGKRARYDGRLYRCVQAHTSQTGWEPPNVPALWVRTAPDGEIPEWVQPTGSQDAYNTGDKVRFDGDIYESLMDGNVWSPADYPQGWRKVE